MKRALNTTLKLTFICAMIGWGAYVAFAANIGGPGISASPPVSVSALTGLGANVGTALAIDVGSEGTIVVNGGLNASPTSNTINGISGSGSDIAGGNLILEGGKGTGLANSGYVGIKYPLKGITGSTLQTLSTLTNYSGGFIYVSTADLTLTASTATTGTLIPAQTNALPQGTLTLDANILRVGTIIRIKSAGLFTMSAGGPTLTIDVKMGSTVVATAVFRNTTTTNGSIWIDCILVCRSTGASGTVMGDGALIGNINTSAYALQGEPLYKAVTTIDTTASQTLDVFGTWSANTAGNSVTFTNVTIEYR